MRRSSLFFFLGLLYVAAKSQLIGNEWIRFDQQYFKFEIEENAFYRLTSAELQGVGFPVSEVQANTIKIYRRGRQIPVRVVTNEDGITLNYLEFWGVQNDGRSDTELYEPGTQPHTEYNLFSDRAAYFLTWDNANPGLRLRISDQTDNLGLAPEPFHLQVEKQILTENYCLGRRIGGFSELVSTDYNEGEGFTGPRIGKNQFNIFEFPVSNLVSAATGEIRVVLTGRNSQQHRVQVEVGPDQTQFSVLGEITFSGISSIDEVLTFDPALLSGSENAYIRITALGFPGSAESVSVAVLEFRYPQEYMIPVDADKSFRVPENPAGRSFLRIATPNPAEYEFFDVSSIYEAIKLPQVNLDSRVELVLPGTNTRRLLHAVRGRMQVRNLERTQFERIERVDRDYLIVYPEVLNDPQSGSAIDQYIDYRSSQAGGNFRVEGAEAQQIYNQFNYGDFSPVAIKRLMLYGNSYYENALLIGKGYDVTFNFHRNNPGELNLPTFGHPGGDMPYTKGLSGTDPILPGYPVGRVIASTPGEVLNYLNKVKEFEATGFDDLWRKNVLQLSGGRTQNELTTFANYVQTFQNLVEGDYLGGRARNLGKTTSAISEPFNISDEINNGVGLVTLFGHSSTEVTDIEIGKVNEFGYDNKGRYPLILVNGCNAGGIFTNSETFGESWILEQEKGAVGFIANSGFALSGSLKRFSDQFYEVTYTQNNTFGRTVGANLIDSFDRLLEIFGGETYHVQVLQTVLHGDPAVKPFAADQPDFQTEDDFISLSSFSPTSTRVLAQEDSFRVDVIVRNFAKTTLDSLRIGINRTLPDGSIMDTVFITPSVRRFDTLRLTLPNPDRESVEGLNIFRVQLDRGDSIAELNENNNTGVLEYFILRSNTPNLYPRDLSYGGGDSIRFLWQVSDPLAEEMDFELGIATSPRFESESVLANYMVRGEALISREVAISELNLTDTTTLFWRTRVANPQTTSDSLYSVSSFTWIPTASEEGWGLFSDSQIAFSQFAGIRQTSVPGELVFEKSTAEVNIFTMGTSSFNRNDFRVEVNGQDMLLNNSTIDPGCRRNTINAMVFDRESTQLERLLFFGSNDADALIDQICGRQPQVIYNFTAGDLLGSQRYMRQLIERMENGDKIVLFNLDSVAYSGWDGTLLATLTNVGIDTDQVGQLVDGQAIVITGEKGQMPGQAVFSESQQQLLPVKQRNIDYQETIEGFFTSGSIETPRVGPVSQWGALIVRTQEEASDSVRVEVELFDRQGRSMPFTSANGRSETIDLSSVDASQYPFAQFRLFISDQDQQTAPGLQSLSLSYVLPPEGLVVVPNKSSVTVQEGEDLTRTFSFLNISAADFSDSIDFRYRIINRENGNTLEASQTLTPLSASDTAIAEVSISSFGRVGDNDLFATFNSREVELYTFNNSLVFAPFLQVESDETNPVLDVTFDGKYIMDGDIVSPNPQILILLKDENPYLITSDTSSVRISIKSPVSETFERVNFEGEKLSLRPATEEEPLEVAYQPGPLEDGIYTLRVQGQDATGNEVSSQPYEISFEVISESTVTHFYPYPNPFSTACRFVYTLTGSELPDQLKVQIMTISGRVVREIDLAEFGNMHIGNNISEFVWDGTDEYGDKLANGVYLYRVILRVRGEQIKHRSTFGDRAFKNGFGKLYILR